MARESTQHKLDRVRSPRVHITYDVEIGDAIEMKELPFVMGVLGDLTGQPEQPLAALKDRKFVEINPDNFDTVLKGMQPHLAFTVPNKLSDDPNAGQISVNLKFESLDDFSPGAIAHKVPALNALLQARTQLSNLITYMDGKTGAEELIAKVLKNPALLQTLASSPKPASS